MPRGGQQIGTDEVRSAAALSSGPRRGTGAGAG